MCLVLDANSFPAVFRTDTVDHKQFRPVTKWIMGGPGFLVYGGTTYKNELREMSKYWSLVLELKKRGRVKEINDNVVNKHERKVKLLVGTCDCDDCHIIAIFRASGCQLLCSKDRRADKYIKKKTLYDGGQTPPAIYRSIKHVTLLCKERIVNLRNLV